MLFDFASRLAAHKRAEACLVPAANLTEIIRRTASLQAEFGCDNSIKGERWPER
jgi:hypothetical protein